MLDAFSVAAELQIWGAKAVRRQNVVEETVTKTRRGNQQLRGEMREAGE